jgi:hypothetical protein
MFSNVYKSMFSNIVTDFLIFCDSQMTAGGRG